MGFGDLLRKQNLDEEPPGHMDIRDDANTPALTSSDGG